MAILGPRQCGKTTLTRIGIAVAHGERMKTLDSRPGTLEKLPTEEQPTLRPGGWSSDGKVMIGVASNDVTHHDIWVYTADDRKLRPWLRTQYWERHPDLSPDGKWVAYSSPQSGRREVYVRPLDAEAPVIQISTDGGRSPAWAKDGSELFYRERDKFFTVTVSEDGPSLRFGDPQELYEGQYGFSTPIRNYDVFADGRFVHNKHPQDERITAVIEQVCPDRIQVVQGWLAELRP